MQWTRLNQLYYSMLKYLVGQLKLLKLSYRSLLILFNNKPCIRLIGIIASPAVQNVLISVTLQIGKNMKVWNDPGCVSELFHLPVHIECSSVS